MAESNEEIKQQNQKACCGVERSIKAESPEISVQQRRSVNEATNSEFGLLCRVERSIEAESQEIDERGGRNQHPTAD